MKFLDNLIRKYANTAGMAVSAGVKQDIKAGFAEALPTIIGLGTIIVGIIACDGKAGTKAATKSAIRTVTVITNNYFLDAAMKEDVISKIMK